MLGFSPGELSELFSGKRKLSLRAAARISPVLDLNDEEAQHLVRLVQDEKRASSGIPAPASKPPDGNAFVKLKTDRFSWVSDLSCFSILSLFETRNFRWDPKWIAKRLALTEMQVKLAIARLVQVGMLDKKKAGGYKVSRQFHFDPEGVPSEVIRNFHRQVLSKATEALDFQPQEKREISGLTFAVDPDVLPAMKKEIIEFLKTFNERYGQGKRLKEVYQLQFALFQLTQSAEGR